MSVQVRRRREAAAYLQTFVGAQGELLVDTTNNRVQVHDGATPGGWPAARIADLSGRNAVINGNFAINQRAYVSGTALAAGAYAHDRWKAGAGGTTYTFTQTVPDTTVTITAGTLVQALDAPDVYSAAYWLSWIGSAQARVWQGSAAGAFTTSPILVTGLALGTITNLEFGTGTLGLAQFEAALSNAGPTRFERRHGELSLCLRYYQTLGLTIRAPATAAGQNFECTVSFTPMRTVPTAAFTGLTQARGNQTAVNVYLVATSLNSARLNIISAAAGDTYALVDVWSFSAEI